MLFCTLKRTEQRLLIYLLQKKYTAADLILRFNIVKKNKKKGLMVFTLRQFVQKKVESCILLLQLCRKKGNPIFISRYEIYFKNNKKPSQYLELLCLCKQIFIEKKIDVNSKRSVMNMADISISVPVVVFQFYKSKLNLNLIRSREGVKKINSFKCIYFSM